MALIRSDKNIAIWTLTAISVLFGLLTIFSGGLVLFGGSSSQRAAGNYIPFDFCIFFKGNNSETRKVN